MQSNPQMLDGSAMGFADCDIETCSNPPDRYCATSSICSLALVEIGWELPSGQFVNQIELCIDEDSYATLWTRHVVSGSAIKQQDVNDRPNFRRDNHDETGYDELFPNFDSQGDIAK